MSSRKLQEDFNDAITLMQHAVDSYWQGVLPAYKNAAIELRKLLCDKPPLLTRVFNNLPMREVRMGKGILGALVDSGISVRFENGKVISVTLFDENAPTLALERWLEQEVICAGLTIRELIKSVADKLAAHADPIYNETILKARLIKFRPASVNMESLHIIAIAEYLLAELKEGTSDKP